MSSSRLEDAFSFYLSYHSNEANQWIHIFCVWPIVFTAQVLLAYSPTINDLLSAASIDSPLKSLTLPSFVALNLNLLFSLKYATYYAYVEQPGIAGLLSSVLVVLGYIYSQTVVESNHDSWKIALGIHIFCWAAQIFGHQVFEKRSPAFIDNLTGALITAPLFVLMEVLMLFGYKAEFKAEMQRRADENIRQFKASRIPKKTN